MIAPAHASHPCQSLYGLDINDCSHTAANATDTLGEDAKSVFSGVKILAEVMNDFTLHLIQFIVPGQFDWLVDSPLILSLISYGLLVAFFMVITRLVLKELTKTAIVVIMVVVAAALMVPIIPTA